MNIIILTPDRVGSTLLQRVITIYMQLHNYGQPVINLHELTNGLMRYYHEDFQAEVLGKPRDWGYFQTLPEIVDLLKSVPHYKTSRLARYHIQRRQDSIADQIDFYNYINENFYVIAARREDLFEHALSWCIFAHTKKLNVFTHQEKFQNYAALYENPITIERENLVKYLDDYLNYLDWVDRYFQVQSYFEYERDVADLERYVLSLPIWPNKQSIGWKETFDISWQDYNRCHYLLSDMSETGYAIGYSSDPKIQGRRSLINYSKPVTTRDVIASLSTQDQQFLVNSGTRYVSTQERIRELVDRKVLVTGVPIKLQTLLEKQRVIRNYREAQGWYQAWAEEHGRTAIDPDQRQLRGFTEAIEYHASPVEAEKLHQAYLNQLTTNRP